MAITRGQVRGVLVSVMLGTAALAIAEPQPRPITIRCGATCTTYDAPKNGEAVVVSVEGAAVPKLQILVGRIPRTCALPCQVSWPGLDHVSVSGKPVTSPVPLNSKFGIPATGGFEPGATKALGALLEGRLAEQQRIQVVGGTETPERNKHPVEKPTLVGPATTTTPTQPPVENPTLVGPGTIGTPTITGPATAQPTPLGEDDLDTYVSDVVLVTSPTIGCSGIVIGRRTVLTARHCSSAVHIGVEREARQIEMFDVVRRDAPPDPALDIATLTVSRDLGVATRTRATAVSDLPTTGLARMVGFGTNDVYGTVGFGLKRQAYVGIASWACDSFSASILGCLPGREISFASDVADACFGDSGGPVMDVVDGHWRLVAIASRGVPGYGTPCGHGGIYTHVGAVADWLNAEIKKDSR